MEQEFDNWSQFQEKCYLSVSVVISIVSNNIDANDYFLFGMIDTLLIRETGEQICKNPNTERKKKDKNQKEGKGK